MELFWNNACSFFLSILLRGNRRGEIRFSQTAANTIEGEA